MNLFFSAVKKCEYPVAVTFILGSSKTLSKKKFQKLKEFLKAVSDKFTISPFHTTVGIIILTRHKSIIFNLGQFTTNQDFNDAVDNIPYINETMRLDEAMLTATSLLTESQGEDTRSDVPNLVVVLADGFRNRSPDSLSLKDAAGPLLNNNVQIIAVCIGNEIDMQELESVVMDRKDVIVSSSYTELRWRTGQVAMAISQKLGEFVIRSTQSSLGKNCSLFYVCSRSIHIIIYIFFSTNFTIIRVTRITISSISLAFFITSTHQTSPSLL